MPVFSYFRQGGGMCGLPADLCPEEQHPGINSGSRAKIRPGCCTDIGQGNSSGGSIYGLQSASRAEPARPPCRSARITADWLQRGSRSCIQGGKGYKAVKKQEKSGIKSSGQIIPLQVHLLNKMQFSPDLAKNGIGSANYKIAKHYK